MKFTVTGHLLTNFEVNLILVCYLYLHVTTHTRTAAVSKQPHTRRKCHVLSVSPESVSSLVRTGRLGLPPRGS